MTPRSKSWMLYTLCVPYFHGSKAVLGSLIALNHKVCNRHIPQFGPHPAHMNILFSGVHHLDLQALTSSPQMHHATIIAM